MPQSNVPVPSQGWSTGAIGPIASGGVVRVQNIGGNAVIVQAFASEAAALTAVGDGPSAGGITVWEREGAQLLMAQAFPGVPGATHLRAYCPFGGSTLAVSHG